MNGLYFALYEYPRFAGDGMFNLGLFTTFEKATDHVRRPINAPWRQRPAFARRMTAFSAGGRISTWAGGARALRRTSGRW
jgi:hypothetical protein